MKRRDKTDEVYAFIKQHIEENNFAPTVREIMQELGCQSTATAQYYINKLEKSGRIERLSNKNRTISIKGQKSRNAQIPILGKVSAGLPILAVENIEGFMVLPDDMYNDGDMFILTVEGDSMIGAGIFNGDRIIVKQTPLADNNNIVVAMIDEDVTVKRFFRKSDCFILHAENEKYRDITVTDENAFSVLGVVIGSIRKF